MPYAVAFSQGKAYYTANTNMESTFVNNGNKDICQMLEPTMRQKELHNDACPRALCTSMSKVLQNSTNSI